MANECARQMIGFFYSLHVFSFGTNVIFRAVYECYCHDLSDVCIIVFH